MTNDYRRKFLYIVVIYSAIFSTSFHCLIWTYIIYIYILINTVCRHSNRRNNNIIEIIILDNRLLSPIRQLYSATHIVVVLSINMYCICCVYGAFSFIIITRKSRVSVQIAPDSE